MYRLQRGAEIEEFDRRRAGGEGCELRNCDFRTIDLRGLEFGDCYPRQADPRGVDLSEANHDGASIREATISGTRFPSALSTGEITLSLTHGTRMRYGGQGAGTSYSST